MPVAAASTWVFAALLLVAGRRKLTQPAITGAALQGAKLPSHHVLVRLLGSGEMLLGAAVLALGGRLPAALLAVTYAAFAVFAWRQSRRGADCGCFGAADAPATTVHVAVNALGAAGAVTAAVMPGPPLLTTISTHWVHGLLAITLIAVGAAAVRLLLTVVPELTAAASLNAPGADA